MNTVETGSVKWEAPSNIALIKYWGKYGNQLPKNPSISFTLNSSKTITTVDYKKLSSTKDKKISFKFYFEGQEEKDFSHKISQYLLKISEDFQFLKNYHLEIHSENTFPHSAGIASSASSMAALALCLMSIEEIINPEKKYDEFNFFKQASYYARIGSGSAGRSLFPGLVIWGKNDQYNESDQEFCHSINDLNPLYQDYKDAILIVSKEKKKVLSRAGHGMMEEHPFAQSRFNQARENFNNIIKAMRNDPSDDFNNIVENEALTLHALMMTSNPSYTLLKPESLSLIEKIRNFRSSTGINCCFTIDAGPNIHLLYPAKDAPEVESFINSELTVDLENGQWIADSVGNGPKKLY